MIALLLSVLAAAQDQPQATPAPQAPPQQTTVTLTTTDSYRFEADLEDEGDVALLQLKASIDVMHLASQRDIWTFNGYVDWLHYDFSRDSDLSAGGDELFEDVYVMRAEATYMRVFDMQWTGVALASIAHAFESGASIGDAATFALGVGALYRVDQNLTIGLMLRLQTRIEDSPYLYPIPYIDWKISPRMALRTEQKPGYGFALSYLLAEGGPLALDGRGYYATRRFRLDDNDVLDEGVIEDDRVALDVGLRYQPSPRLTGGLYVGLDLWQLYSVEDKRGNNRAEINTDPALFIAFSLGYSF